MGLFLGFDPGGAGAFGWCLLSGSQQPLQIIKRGVTNHAAEAVKAAFVAAGTNQVTALGIDAPLFWQPQGDRSVDQIVRGKVVQLGCHGGTVNAVNSMRGACLIQGMMAAMLARAKVAQLPITESHPKALLWLLKIAKPGNPTGSIALAHLNTLVGGNVAGASDHERDAALAAFSAYAMTLHLPGWQDMYLQEPDPMTPLVLPLAYWLPI